jgi:hypothetical protein
MLKVYVLIVVLGILGGIGYGAKYYYDTTQATIATLRENNVKLERAVETAEASIAAMLENAAKLQELNNQLAADLRQAEAYSDELRSKFSRLDLVQDALRDSEKLEGKMNGATAKLWRELMSNTGNSDDRPLPGWLQQPAGTGDQGSNQGGEDTNTNSIPTEATTAN